MAAPAPAAFSTQQRQKSLTSTGPHVQAVSLTSQQVLQRLRSWCLSSNITTNLQAKTNSWFNYKSLSWGITEEWDDMKLSWNSGCSLSRLRDTGIVGPWAKQGDEDTRPHWEHWKLAHTSETWGKYTADLKCFGSSVHQKLLKRRINLISMTTWKIVQQHGQHSYQVICYKNQNLKLFPNKWQYIRTDTNGHWVTYILCFKRCRGLAVIGQKSSHFLP